MIARLREEPSVHNVHALVQVQDANGELPAIVRKAQPSFSPQSAFSLKSNAGFANWHCLAGVALTTLVYAAVQFGMQRPDPCAADLAKLATQHGITGFVSPATDDNLAVHVGAGKTVDVCLVSSDGRVGELRGEPSARKRVTVEGKDYEGKKVDRYTSIYVQSPDENGAHYQAVAFADGQPVALEKGSGIYDVMPTPEAARTFLADYGLTQLYRAPLDAQSAEVVQPIARFVLAWQAAGLPKLDARGLEPLRALAGRNEGALRFALKVLDDRELVQQLQPTTKELVDFGMARQRHDSGIRVADLKDHFQRVRDQLGYSPRLADAQALYNTGTGTIAKLEEFLVSLQRASGGKWSPANVQEAAPLEWLRTHVPWAGEREIRVGKEDIRVTGAAFLDATAMLANRYGLSNPTDHQTAIAILGGADQVRSRRLTDLLDVVRPKNAADSQALAELSLQPLSRWFSDEAVIARAVAEKAKGRMITPAVLQQIARAMANEPVS